MSLTRRNLLRDFGGALVAAPFVAQSGILMPVKQDRSWILQTLNKSSGRTFDDFKTIRDEFKFIEKSINNLPKLGD